MPKTTTINTDGTDGTLDMSSLSLGDSSILSLPHVASKIFNTPLAIIPAKASEIVLALQSRFGITDASSLHNFVLFGDDEDERRREIEVFNGEAIIPIEGTLVNGKVSASMAAMSGLRSYQSIREDVEEAQDIPGVDRALFMMNSGGGEAAGLFDFVDWLNMTAADFPIRTFISHMGGSAAFAVAAATNEIIVSQSAHVGSVGTFMLLTNVVEANRMRGVQVIPVFAGARKIDGLPSVPLSEQALEAIQGRVDTVNTLLVEKVAAFRDMDEEAVLATQAGILIGQQALAVNFADAVGTEDSVTQVEGGQLTMAVSRKQETMTLTDFREKYPEFCEAISKDAEKQALSDSASAIAKAEEESNAELAQLKDDHTKALATAKEEGATAERERIQAIYQQASKAKLFSVFEKAAFEEPMSAQAAGGLLYESLVTKKEERRADFSAEFINPLDVASPADDNDGVGAASGDEMKQEASALAAWTNDRRKRGDRSRSESVNL